MNKNDFTTITLQKSTKKRLEKHGRKNISFDSLVSEILDQVEKDD